MTGKTKEQVNEEIKRELWFTFFTEHLYKNNLITEEQKRDIIKKI